MSYYCCTDEFFALTRLSGVVCSRRSFNDFSSLIVHPRHMIMFRQSEWR